MPSARSNVALRLLLFVYFCLGFCPTAIAPNRNRRLAACGPIVCATITVAHFVLSSAQLLLVLSFHTVIFSPRDTFGRINDTIKYCGIAFTYYAICIESFVRRHRHVQFWQRYVRLHQTKSQQPTAAASKQPEEESDPSIGVDRRFLLEILGFHAMVVSIEMVLLPIVLHNEQSLNFWLMYCWTVQMSRLRHWQFMQYVAHVEAELRRVAQGIENIARYSAYGGRAPTAALKSVSACATIAGDECWQRFVWNRLRWAQKRYETLFEMTLDVNEIFGWSQLANCLHSFVQLLSDMYWVYWRFYNDKSFPLIQYVTCLVPSLVIIVYVFRTSNRCTLQAREISVHLHNIKKSTVSSALATLIETFSLQILHQPIEFHAKGFFRMNYDPLRDMIGAITTYMVFFIQFTPKLKNEFEFD